jgi:hypothetical protein
MQYQAAYSLKADFNILVMATPAYLGKDIFLGYIYALSGSRRVSIGFSVSGWIIRDTVGPSSYQAILRHTFGYS